MSEYVYATDEHKGHWLTGEEIVRCRDCKHGIKADLSGNWYECMKPDGNGDYARWDVEPDGFCSWSCRRSDKE